MSVHGCCPVLRLKLVSLLSFICLFRDLEDEGGLKVKLVFTVGNLWRRVTDGMLQI